VILTRNLVKTCIIFERILCNLERIIAQRFTKLLTSCQELVKKHSRIMNCFLQGHDKIFQVNLSHRSFIILLRFDKVNLSFAMSRSCMWLQDLTKSCKENNVKIMQNLVKIVLEFWHAKFLWNHVKIILAWILSHYWAWILQDLDWKLVKIMSASLPRNLYKILTSFFDRVELKGC